jgi:hypothetical protein
MSFHPSAPDQAFKWRTTFANGLGARTHTVFQPMICRRPVGVNCKVVDIGRKFRFDPRARLRFGPSAAQR